MKKWLPLMAIFIVLNLTLEINAQNFSIQGTKIIAPSGSEFTPLGANVNGFNFGGWEKNVINNTNNAYNAIVNDWRFNCLRAQVHIYAPKWNNQTTDVAFLGNETNGFAALDKIVNRYTAAKVVVMIAAMDYTGIFPTTTTQMNDLKSFWKQVAARYKNNTYVWFNLLNEPGYNQPCSVLYREVHQALISVIRDSVGAKNIIVVDGTQYGQDAASWDDRPIATSNSGILTYGSQLLSFNNKTYPDILFSVHLYDQWAYNNTAFTNKLSDFVTRVKNAGLALMIGECGATGTNDVNRAKACEVAYYALKNYKIGMLAWHWEPGDGFQLVTGNGAFRGDQINNNTNPTNLSSWEGYYFWRATHSTVTSTKDNESFKSTVKIYPNPANPLSVIRYQLSENSNVNIFICDVLGKEVMQVINENQNVGAHQINFNTEQLHNGIYFVKMNINGEQQTQKLIVSKSE